MFVASIFMNFNVENIFAAVPPQQLNHDDIIGFSGSQKILILATTTISSVAFYLGPDSGNYCCSQAYVKIYRDNNDDIGDSVATSTERTFGQYVAPGEFIFNFDSLISLEPGLYWLAINHGPSQNTNGIIIYGSLSNTYNDGYWGANTSRDAYSRLGIVETPREPVVIVPGIMGSRLNRVSNGEEVWPNVSQMRFPGDTYLDDLQLSTGGIQIAGKEMNASSAIEEESNRIFYKNLIHNLIGYTENVNLFVVPYDWRLDIQSQINKLDSVVSQAIAASTDGKINIIAHSMGGLLTRDYLVATSSSQFLDKLILLGTPNLGAPKIAKIINYGDDLDFKINLGLFDVGILNTDEAKKISQNMPAVYELLPSRNYFSAIGSYIDDFSSGTDNFLNYDETKQFLINQGRNSELLALADAYHVRDSTSINAPKIYNIVGCENFNTIGGFLVYPDGRYDLGYTDGDGTVPFGSANSISSTTLTYYAPFDTTGVDHLGLVKDSNILNIIDNILNDNPLFSSGNVSRDATPCTQGSPNAIIFETHSPVSLSVYDSQNRHLGPTSSGTIEFGIPGASYDVIEHNSFVRVPEGDTYRVVINGTASGTAEFDIKSASGATITNKAVYQNIPITGNQTVANAIFSGFQGDLTLNLDSNGDGVTDSNIQPSAVLSGSQSADITPPMLIMPLLASTTILNATATLSFSATDSESGVASVMATLNGVGVTNGQTIAFSKLGDNVFTLKAVDNAGNPRVHELRFSVVYNFSGFLPPVKIDNSGLYKLGRTLPVKFQLTDASGSFISSASAQLFVAKIQDNTVGTDEIALSTGNADNGNNFRYDSTSHQYIFNLYTGTLSVGKWQLKVVLDDGKNYTVKILIK